jgi:tRNA threonylcarbamoyladenosine biosynthesis protein TsaE
MAESGPLILADPLATRAEGARLAAALQAVRPEQLTVYLEGDLGTGKTTFAQGFLEGLGHKGRVPSPTFTLVEPYALCGYRIYHVDLYRIRDERELEPLGLAEQFGPGVVTLFEWPEHGAGQLSLPDIRAKLVTLPTGRSLTYEALTDSGRRIVAEMRSA